MKKWLKKAIPFVMSASVLAGMITLVNVFAEFTFEQGSTQCTQSHTNITEKQAGDQVDGLHKVADGQTVYYCADCTETPYYKAGVDALEAISDGLDDSTYFTENAQCPSGHTVEKKEAGTQVDGLHKVADGKTVYYCSDCSGKYYYYVAGQENLQEISQGLNDPDYFTESKQCPEGHTVVEKAAGEQVDGLHKVAAGKTVYYCEQCSSDKYYYYVEGKPLQKIESGLSSSDYFTENAQCPTHKTQVLTKKEANARIDGLYQVAAEKTVYYCSDCSAYYYYEAGEDLKKIGSGLSDTTYFTENAQCPSGHTVEKKEAGTQVDGLHKVADGKTVYYCEQCSGKYYYYEAGQDLKEITSGLSETEYFTENAQCPSGHDVTEKATGTRIDGLYTVAAGKTVYYCTTCEKYYYYEEGQKLQEITSGLENAEYFTKKAQCPSNHDVTEKATGTRIDGLYIVAAGKTVYYCTTCEKYYYYEKGQLLKEITSGLKDATYFTEQAQCPTDGGHSVETKTSGTHVDDFYKVKAGKTVYYCTTCEKYYCYEAGQEQLQEIIETNTTYFEENIQCPEQHSATRKDAGEQVDGLYKVAAGQTVYYCETCDEYYYKNDMNLEKITNKFQDTTYFTENAQCPDGHSVNALTSDQQIDCFYKVKKTTVYYCETCDKYYYYQEGQQLQEIVSKLEDTTYFESHIQHEDLQHTSEKQATCVASGMKEYWYCSACGKYYESQENANSNTGAKDNTTTFVEEIDPKNHNSLKKTEAVAGTCTEPGMNEYWYCSDCKNYYASETDGKNNTDPKKDTSSFKTEMNSNNHTNLTKTEAVAPTCTEAGNIAYWYCSGCKKYYTDVAGTKETTLDATVIKAAGHTITAVEAKAATCTEDGNTAYWYCTVCKKYFSDAACTTEITLASTVITAGHTITAIEAKAATATEDGNSAYWHCTVCDKYFSDAACTVEITLADTVIPATGSPEVNGEWVQDDNGWWFSHEDGSYQTSGWESVNGTWYYFNESGYMETGWVKDGETWYYMQESGAMETGWVQDGETWYYMAESGAMETGWVQDGETWYYMQESGAMETGWVKDGETWYYMAESGAMETGWVQDGETWYYMQESGAMETGWKLVNGTWYYLQENGAMATGWLNDGGTWYYLQESGAMATGWQLINETWYYLQANGAMATGWLNDGGTWYYLQENGAMATNTYIDSYYVDANGVWVQ